MYVSLDIFCAANFVCCIITVDDFEFFLEI